VQDSKRP